MQIVSAFGGWGSGERVQHPAPGGSWGLRMKICDVCGRCYEDPVFVCSEGNHPSLLERHSGSCEMIAGYRLDHRLESSVVSDTYRARHIVTGRSCLVKIYPPNAQDSQQFIAQAAEAAALIDPNVVNVYTAGTLDGGELFVVEEEPAGATLRGFLNGTGLPDRLTTIQVVRQVAEGLQAIHAKGLVHRAIRPENIFLTDDGEGRPCARINGIDFCGRFEHTIISDKVLMDSAAGSLEYFAPEQCCAQEVTFKADLYALGVVLYEMLAGRPPFDATTAAALIEMHKDQRPPELRIDDPDLRMLLTHTLTESLSKQPERRHLSALDFARQMRHIEQLAAHGSATSPHAIAHPVAPPLAAPIGLSAKAAAAAPLEVRTVPSSALGAEHFANDMPGIPKLLSVKPANLLPVPRTAIPPEQPEDDIPTIEDVLAVVAAEPLSRMPDRTMITVPAEAETPEDVANIAPSRKPANFPLGSGRRSAAVRALKPATGDVLRFPDLSDEPKREIADEGSPARFTPSPRDRFSHVRTALEIVGGLLALTVIAILSGIIIATNGPIETSNPSLAETTTPALQDSLPSSVQQDSLPSPQPSVVVSAPLKNFDRFSRKPRSVDVERPKFTKPRAVRAEFPPRRDARRNMMMSSFVPSTLVIYAENGIVKSRLEPQTGFAQK